MESHSTATAAATRCGCPSPTAGTACVRPGRDTSARRECARWRYSCTRCRMRAARPRRPEPDDMSSRRSFVLMGGGALLGLLMAGYSLFTARGTSTLIVPPEDVALVNQQPISRSDYLLQLQTLYAVDLAHATAAQRRKVLDDMIREELFVQRGKELDVASIDPDVRAAMVNSVELEIAADAITAQPSEAQLHGYYAAHQARYASEGIMTLRDYLFRAGDANVAAAAADLLKSSPPTPALLAQWHAADSGRVSGEEFYFA